ncbi:transcobalamin-2-like isoform X2 [Ornithodoros turicata]|uniref:transcobalamin-2-like isoform X2 n=1 Tax=Ornithodoros turicata TaxID=34597 RepID=UPI003139ADC2
MWSPGRLQVRYKEVIRGTQDLHSFAFRTFERGIMWVVLLWLAGSAWLQPCTGFELEPKSEQEQHLPTPEEALIKAHAWLREHSCNETLGRAPRQAHRRAIALALTEPYFFETSTCVSQPLLHVRELQLQLVTQISSGSASAGQLALHVLGHAAACQNPRDVLGMDLVALLQEEKERHFNTTGHRNRYSEALQILAYCTLDIRNPELWNASLQNLHELKHLPAASLIPDSVAMNILALMCLQGTNSTSRDSINQEPLMIEALHEMASSQKPDGSFGNVHSTALAAQALKAAGYISWNSELAMQFLLRHQKSNGDFGGFLATYSVLPLLAGTTMAQLRRYRQQHCEIYGDLSENYLLSSSEMPVKRIISVWYSIWVGGEAHNRSSTTVWISSGSSMLDVMRTAAEKDSRFRFEWEESDFGPYVTSVSGIPSNATTHEYWLGHSMNFITGVVTPLQVGVGSHIVNDSDHVIMWYKQLHF